MKLLTNLNPELLERLERYRNWFNEQDDINTIIPDKDREGTHTLESATSPEYLKEVQKDTHVGTPECAIVTDFHISVGSPTKYRNASLELCTDVCAFLGAKFTAVHAYYPADGFMGWHCNWDTPGYNILLSYSENDQGFFKYTDKGGNIVTMYDSPGWSAKVGYFGGKDEGAENIVWHCAGSKLPRQTLGFVIPDRDMWQMMIDDIDDKPFNRSLFP